MGSTSENDFLSRRKGDKQMSANKKSNIIIVASSYFRT
jgi:hypothetical protein